jgi:phospholipid/cholesterol/gamma-HCH transport system substrate-binding protein
MENRAHALAAGLFTLLLGLAVVATAMWFRGSAVEEDSYTLMSRVSVSGLNLQAPVRYRGLDVGKVTSIDIDPLNPGAILISIAVRTGTPITRSTFAQLAAQGITGLSYVLLDDDGSKPEQLRGEDARIEVRPSFFDSISASGEQTMANFNQVATKLNELLEEKNQAQLMRVLANLETTTARVTALADALQPTAKALNAHSDIVLKRTDELLLQLNQRMERVDRVLTSTDQFAANGAVLTEAMATETVPKLNLLMDDLQRSSRALERLLNNLDEQPSSIVFGRPAPAPGPGESGYGGSGR